jgi:hypothetical protein
MAEPKPEPPKRETRDHLVIIPVIENVEHAMYLREGIITGKTADGREIACDLAGASLVIQLDNWRKKGGRQFVVTAEAITVAVLEQLTDANANTEKKKEKEKENPDAH